MVHRSLRLPLESQPGDLVIFNQGLKHSSWVVAHKRRMFTINCGYRYKEDEIDLLRKEIDLVSRFGEGKVYGDKMIETAGPERLVHLEQALALAPNGVWTCFGNERIGRSAECAQVESLENPVPA